MRLCATSATFKRHKASSEMQQAPQTMNAELASRVEQQLLVDPQCTSTAVIKRSAGVAGKEEQPASLLALPDACLLAVLQCLAADGAGPACVFSAARAHSRLQQAAVAALTSISVQELWQQQQVDGVLLYLEKHGQHVSSVSLRGADPEPDSRMYHADLSTVQLRQLPSHLQLSSLNLHFLQLQLQSSGDYQGVLGASSELAALRQLRLSKCTLLDGEEGLTAALSLLPGLEHLSIYAVRTGKQKGFVGCPASSLQQLQHLTYLELHRVELRGPDPASPVLQEVLQGLTRLADLRISGGRELVDMLTASALSGRCCLTRLVVFGNRIESTALAGQTQLQHLQLTCCQIPADLLKVFFEQVQQLQQLTFLNLLSSLTYAPITPVAAYSALTASSKLRHLNIDRNTVPPGVWQHVFPAGRQLPHLTSLIMWNSSYMQALRPFGGCAAAPDGSLIVRCCPALQSLNMRGLRCTEEGLAPLQRLRTLTTLLIDTDEEEEEEEVWEVDSDCEDWEWSSEGLCEDSYVTDGDGSEVD